MFFWELIFFMSTFLVFFNYIGYALVAVIINKYNPKYKTANTGNYQPSVSFIVAAYNEEDIIEEKVCNTLQLAYPASKIEFIFITDGSTDNTPYIIGKYPAVKLLHTNERNGKSAALNRAVSVAGHDILIMSDANTFLNNEAIKHIASHYEDSVVGGVAGEKRVAQATEDISDVGNREGLYWKYESFLKKIDSEFYSVVGAAGELLSVRRKLYEPIPDSVILDDFVLSLKTAQKGYRIIYEPRAYAVELSSISIKDERKRKIRIAAGGFQAIKMLSSLFKFWKHPRLTFLYISHRVLRWYVSPSFLVFAFISNLFIILNRGGYFYLCCFIVQAIFYLTAIISVFISSNSKLKFLKVAGYFVFMNISVIQGFFRFVFNKQTSVWEKVKRTSSKIQME
jgi:biofilm PGA synthesis N-glycosyltransferase PgaC